MDKEMEAELALEPAAVGDDGLVRCSYAPAVITADWDGMQARLDELMGPYRGLTAEVVATMDVREAKACRADLNAMSRELNEARKAVKRDYNAPLREFEARVRELDAQILAPRDLLDEGIKLAEAAERDARRAALEALYADFSPELAALVPFERVMDPRWLNKSYGERKAENELCDRVSGILADWNALHSAGLHDVGAAEEDFVRTLSLREAVAGDERRFEERGRIAAMRAELEGNEEFRAGGQECAPRAYVPPMPARPVRTFRVSVPPQAFRTNADEAAALGNHLHQLGLRFELSRDAGAEDAA